uniref:Uncharacterized protein n=2 Tax=Haptolina brevifila TaxID=156173 RepID=A0A7S2BM07_9EUKA|mmetsp:Transcript_14169/g.28514  ORF Transcript_14169/g.28514 Transcript_14169/m.28514 type:complete len:194 (+) Transcript_14169:155-736(+)
MLNQQLAALQVTNQLLTKQLADAKEAANRTLIEVTAVEEVGNRRRRAREDDIDVDESRRPDDRQRYRSSPSSGNHGDSLDEDSIGMGEYSMGQVQYRGGGDDSDDDEPHYRALPILASSSGPADEFDSEVVIDDEPPTYRSAAANHAGDSRKPLDTGVLQELVTSFTSLATQGRDADENVILQLLQRVMVVLG